MPRYLITHPGTLHRDRVEVRDGAVTFASMGVWVVHRLPWVHAQDILSGMACSIRPVEDGLPWPEDEGTKG